MRRSWLIGLMLLVLPACGKEKAPVATDDGGGPQIATSIDDVALPVDRTDQVTAIDAASGDASGMPADGGAVVRAPKPEAQPAVEPAAVAATTVPPPAAAPAPMVVPPPVAEPTAPPPAGQ